MVFWLCKEACKATISIISYENQAKLIGTLSLHYSEQLIQSLFNRAHADDAHA
jgi:hypothetical protein